jgi:hypothetical protein
LKTGSDLPTVACLSPGLGLLQRKCACGGTPGPTGECEACRKKPESETLRRKGLHASSFIPRAHAVPTLVDEVLRSPGQPLDGSTRAFMEPRFGHDFSRVLVQNVVPPRMQTKLTVGEPENEYEREADRVADEVMRTPDHDFGKPHRYLGENEVMVRRKETPPGVPEVSPGLETRIHQLKGGGHRLPASTRVFFEPRFGHDFSDVRVHTDARAANSARELDAQAYTVGRDIAFGAGRYAPETLTGRRLLAHELAHVVQQRQGASLKIRLTRLNDFNDKDAAHDPSKLTDAQIEATDEFKSYMDSKLIWQSVEKMTREEALLACRLMLRHLREGHPIVWSSDARVFMDLTRKQAGALKKTEAAVGTLAWVPFNTGVATTDPSKLDSDFGKWILAGGPEPNTTTGKVNCWEMVMFSAFKGGFTTKARITGIYNEAVKQVKVGTRTFVGDTIEVELRRGNEYVLDPKDPKTPDPLPGDIVIFSTAANHVAISRGTKDGSGRHKVVSHWPPPDGSYKTKETTIEELLPKMPPSTIVKFWSPKW